MGLILPDTPGSTPHPISISHFPVQGSGWSWSWSWSWKSLPLARSISFSCSSHYLLSIATSHNHNHKRQLPAHEIGPDLFLFLSAIGRGRGRTSILGPRSGECEGGGVVLSVLAGREKRNKLKKRPAGRSAECLRGV
jgi:hypothetical protein